MNYYNEFDPKAAQWLRNLVEAGKIPKGFVDSRSITEVEPDELKRYTQCHFFAGIAGWSYALQLAGWSTDRPVWTGSCPCQPFSTAGKQKGKADERHLWPVWFRLIRECRPPVVFGEQVAAAVTHEWLDEVATDMESENYAFGSAIIPACGVGAPHKRDRLWFVAQSASVQRNAGSEKLGVLSGVPEDRKISNNLGGRSASCAVAHAESERDRGTIWAGGETSGRQKARNGLQSGGASYERVDVAYSNNTRPQGHGGFIKQHGQAGWKEPVRLSSTSSFWDGEWIICQDGKQRLVEPSIRLLAHGVSARVVKLRALGNAIVPQVAAEFIKAYMEILK